MLEFFNETSIVCERLFMKGFCGISMNDTYWEMFLISNVDMVEIQKAKQATEVLTIAGDISIYQKFRNASFS